MSEIKLPKHIDGCFDYGRAFLKGMKYRDDELVVEKAKSIALDWLDMNSGYYTIDNTVCGSTLLIFDGEKIKGGDLFDCVNRAIERDQAMKQED